LQGFEKRKYRPGFYVNVQSKKAAEQNSFKREKDTSTPLSVTKQQKQVTQIVLQTEITTQPVTNKTETPQFTKTNKDVVKYLHDNENKTKPVVSAINVPDDEVKRAKSAKGWAIAALVCLFLIPYASIVFAIIAYSRGKRLLVNHKYEPEWEGRKDARFAFITGKIILIVSLLLVALITIELTIGICQFLLFVLGVPVC